MNTGEMELLGKLGIIVTKLEYVKRPMHIREMSADSFEDPTVVEVRGKFVIDESRFRSMCHLVRLTDMMCESKNSAVHETYEHLITLLELSK